MVREHGRHRAADLRAVRADREPPYAKSSLAHPVYEQNLRTLSE
jgi:hypothetical protein